MIVIIEHPWDIIRLGIEAAIKKSNDLRILSVSSISSISLEELPKNKQIVYLSAANGSNFPEGFKVTKVYLLANNEDPDSLRDSKYYLSLSASSLDIETLFIRLSNAKHELTDSTLTVREIEILEQVALGLSNKEIADKLFISSHTVITHRKNITEKLGIKSISGLTVYAILNNILDASQINLEDLI